jgi:hypothetical protein
MTHYSFKKLFLAYLFGYMPFGLLSAILSLAHVLPIQFNERPYYGISGFVISILIIPFFGFIFGVINWLYLNFGNFIYNYTWKVLKSGKNKTD